jgi:hypothetical protein
MKWAVFRVFTIEVLVVLSLLSLLPISVLAQGPTIGVEPQTTSVGVGTTFTVDVWIRKVHDYGGLAFFEFKIVWDPQSVELVSYGNHVKQNDANWIVLKEERDSGSYLLKAQDPTMPDFPNNRRFYNDASWATLTFRCLALGDSSIEFPITVQPNRWGYWSDGSDGYNFDEYLNGVVHQTKSMTVGGLVTPTNKLEIVAPFAALAGLIVTVSAVVAVKKRRD